MNLATIALMILRMYSSIGSGIQVSHYEVMHHIIILVFHAIRLVQKGIDQLLHLQICL